MTYQAPGDGRRINIKSNSNSVIDRGTVTLQQGTGIALSQASSTITINQSGGGDYVQAYTANDQTTNLAAGDHIKFDTVTGSSGSSISLDTTTAYTTSGGAASIGRFTLAANKTYFLYANITCAIFSANSAIWFAWYNATSLANIGGVAFNANNARSTTQNLSQAPAVGMITTSTSTLVEVRFAVISNVSQLGAAGFGIYGASATVSLASA